jgi:hypothetical protein
MREKMETLLALAGLEDVPKEREVHGFHDPYAYSVSFIKGFVEHIVLWRDGAFNVETEKDGLPGPRFEGSLPDAVAFIRSVL